MEMNLFSISKSVHVPKFKPTEHFKEITEMAVGKNLVYSLSQQHNMNCEPAVKRGDRILVNQVIGTSTNNSVVPVYSGVSGTVKQITQKYDLMGERINVVLVENDGLYETLERPLLDYKTLSIDELKEEVKKLGLIETQNLSNRKRGLHLSFRKTPKHVLINASESGLYGILGTALYTTVKEDFLKAIEILQYFYKSADMTVLITSDSESLEGFTDMLKGTGVAISAKVPTQFYHDMNLAARDVFGDFAMKETMVIDGFMLPSIARGLVKSQLNHTQMVMVSGGAAKKPGMYRIPHGTVLSEVMEIAGVENPFRIVAGSILNGEAVFATDAPINRGIKELLFLTEAECSIEEEINCIRCGRCADVCPVGLKPYELNSFAIARDYDEFYANRGGMCVECGRCSYICPSKRHLLQSFKTAKKSKR